MNVSELLSEFDDFFVKFSSKEEMILEIFPQINDIELPCSIIEINDSLNNILNQRDLSKLIDFIELNDKSNGINIMINEEWFSVEYRVIDDEEYLHIYSCVNTIERMKDIIVSNHLDPLTQVFDRRAIESYIDRKISIDKITNASMFMLDIDYFKNINDHYGHIFGDEVIIAVARALTSVVGQDGIVGRLGGDEFVLFIESKLTRDGVKNLARLIRYALDNLEINKSRFGVTATIGIVNYPDNGSNYNELYLCCDKALYRGKEKGRDCHIIYTPSMHEKINVGKLPEYDSVDRMSIAGFFNNVTKKLMNPNIKEVRTLCDDIIKFFQLDRISAVFDNRVVVFAENDNYGNTANAYLDLDLDKYNKYFIYDHLLSINDYAVWQCKDEEVYDTFMKAGVVSAVQVMSFCPNGDIQGFISFESIKNRRVWQTGEINYLSIIAGLLRTLTIK